MALIKMETEAVLMLEQSYLLASEKIGWIKSRLASVIGESAELTGSGNSEGCLQAFEELILNLDKDAADISWRREWIQKSDLMLEGYFFFPDEAFSAAGGSGKFSRYSTSEIINLLQNSAELSDQELGALFFELARRTLNAPELANQVLSKFNYSQLDDIFSRLYLDLGNWLLLSDVDAKTLKERQAARLLPFSILIANASWAKNGMSQNIQNYFLPLTESAGSKSTDHKLVSPETAGKRIKYAGMILASAAFAPGFLASAGIYMLNKFNRPAVLAGLAGNKLELPNKSALHKQPFRKMLNPGQTAFDQLKKSPNGYLELFKNPRLAGLKLDIDTLISHNVDFKSIFFEGMGELSDAALNNPQILAELQPALGSLGAFLYRNESQLYESDFLVNSAKTISLFIPDMRSMATQATAPLLAPILKDPDALIVLSGSAGIYALSHLQKALEAEFSPLLSPEEKQRLVSAHADAVSDIYHHIFTAISINEEKIDKSIATLSSTLGLTAKNLFSAVSRKLDIRTQILISTAVFVAGKVKDQIVSDTEALLEADPNLTPRELFSRQIINRDFTAGANSAYPEPTWFEIELANKILDANPLAGEELTKGTWFDGEKLTPPTEAAKIGENISNDEINIIDLVNLIGDANGDISQIQDFSEWFAKTVNADPPTEFSSTFLHFQREFGRDILIDALSIEIDAAIKEARAAKAAADLATQNYLENSRLDSGQR